MSESVVKSAARVLEVLEFFAARRAPASVSDVCAGLSYPQSSTSVLLKSLLTLGYLSYDQTNRRYVPTQRVALLGRWLQESSPKLQQMLSDLHSTTLETVRMAQVNGANVQYIEVLAASDSTARPGAGDVRPLASTAVGRVLLAQLPEQHALRIVRQANSAAEVAHRVDERELIDALAEVRRTGFAIMGGDGVDQITEIAILAPTSIGQAALAIEIAGPSERVRRNREAIMAALRSVAPAPAAESRPNNDSRVTSDNHSIVPPRLQAAAA